MYYKKNASKTLSDELFRNPTCEYRGTPFWAWNAELTKERLSKQIADFKDMGFGGYHMHVRTGMVTEYLTDEFFDFIRHCVGEAEKKDMLAYLYDEDRWPSGSAGGRVTKNNPRLRQRYLMMTSADRSDDLPKEEAVEKGTPFFLGAFRIHLNGKGEMTAFEKVDRQEREGDIRFFFCMVREANDPWFNYSCYIDTLSKPAVDEFIKVTYDAFYREVGDQFGKRIPSIFTDEPRLVKSIPLPSAHNKSDALLAFTHDFGESFEKTFGFSLLEKLPYLFFEGENGSHIRTRYCYYDHLTERFASSFMDNVSEWSASHGILQTGHMMSEGDLQQQAEEVGETMRSYRRMGMPGIDMLVARREFNTAKQCQSALHQYGREAMMSELYGVTNWDYDFRCHKFQGDWQACMGVNVRVPHLAWLSMHGEAKRDYPASINYQSPWYKEYKYIEDHFSRVNAAMTRGKPIVKVGVIHPIESYWLLCGSMAETKDKRNELESLFASVINWLLESSLDFHFISESLLPELHRESDSGFAVGEMAYDAVVVPCLTTLRSTTLKALEEFKAKGGKVIFMGECPAYVDALESDAVKALYEASSVIPASRPRLVKELESVRTVSLSVEGGGLTDDLCYSLREDNGEKWMFIAQLKQPFLFDAVTSRPLVVEIDGMYDVKYYDTLNGEITDAEYECVDGKTRVFRKLYVNDSLLFRFIPTDMPKARIRSTAKKTVWQTDIRTRVPYRRHEKNVVLLDMAQYSFDGSPFSQREEILRIDNAIRDSLGLDRRKKAVVQPYLITHVPEDHTVTLRFTVESTIDVDGVELALERAPSCKITCNGQAVDNTPIGWYVDEDIHRVSLPALGKGTNIIYVTFPFGQRTDIEAMYLLGDFGVRVYGAHPVLVPDETTIGFGSVVGQGMPFYAGNLDYFTEIDLPEDGELVCETTMYRGALVRVTLDDGESECSVFPPYKVSFKDVKKGRHKLTYTVYGQRYNTFAGLHNLRAFFRNAYVDPNYWRSTGDLWTYEYLFRDFGIMKTPEMYLLK